MARSCVFRLVFSREKLVRKAETDSDEWRLEPHPMLEVEKVPTAAFADASPMLKMASKMKTRRTVVSVSRLCS